MRKSRKYKWRKLQKNVKPYIKKFKKVWELWIAEYKFYQNNIPILTNDIDINDQYLIRFLLVKNILNVSLVTQTLKKLDFHAYFIDKWLYINKKIDENDIFIFE